MQRGKRPSIKDVAKEAGVSTATVSYVINGKTSETLAAETIDKVNDAVRRLGYVPNQSARTLTSRRSKLIGIIIPQTEQTHRLNIASPFYGELLSQIEYSARCHGYHLLISGSDDTHNYLSIAVNRNLDGIIMVGTYPDALYQQLKTLQIPIVLIDSYCEDHYYHVVGINDRHGGYLATRHLIEQGHRDIALVSGQIREHGVIEKRYLGYCDALKEAGIALDERRVFAGSMDYEYGLRAVDEMIACPAPVTGVFCAADFVAIGLYKGLRMRGLRIPEDYSLVGFDDVYLAAMMDPGLTTVRQDVCEKGTKALECLLDALERPQIGKREILLPLTVVTRQSVKEMKRYVCPEERG